MECSDKFNVSVMLLSTFNIWPYIMQLSWSAEFEIVWTFTSAYFSVLRNVGGIFTFTRFCAA
jgi:hypothetical protein